MDLVLHLYAAYSTEIKSEKHCIDLSTQAGPLFKDSTAPQGILHLGWSWVWSLTTNRWLNFQLTYVASELNTPLEMLPDLGGPLQSHYVKETGTRCPIFVFCSGFQQYFVCHVYNGGLLQCLWMGWATTAVSVTTCVRGPCMVHHFTEVNLNICIMLFTGKKKMKSRRHKEQKSIVECQEI